MTEPDPEAVMEPILFYGTRAKHGYMSNFSRHPIRLKGQIWPTSEHYFQAQKFAGTSAETAVRGAANPMEAARMGRSRKNPLRSDWERVKDQVMWEAVTAKFSQHPALAEKLLATGDAVLVEHTENDSYWGDGGNGSGKNMLGVILMEVREQLRKGQT